MKVGPLKSWRNGSPNRFSVTLLPPLDFLLLVYTTLASIKCVHVTFAKETSHCVPLKKSLCVVLCFWGICHSKPLISIVINYSLSYYCRILTNATLWHHLTSTKYAHISPEHKHVTWFSSTMCYWCNALLHHAKPVFLNLLLHQAPPPDAEAPDPALCSFWGCTIVCILKEDPPRFFQKWTLNDLVQMWQSRPPTWKDITVRPTDACPSQLNVWLPTLIPQPSVRKTNISPCDTGSWMRSLTGSGTWGWFMCQHMHVMSLELPPQHSNISVITACVYSSAVSPRVQIRTL